MGGLSLYSTQAPRVVASVVEYSRFARDSVRSLPHGDTHCRHSTGQVRRRYR